jgi:hypothetical protein
MKRTRLLLFGLATAAMLVIFVACGGGDDDSANTTAAATTAVEATSTPTAEDESTEEADEATATEEDGNTSVATADNDEPTPTEEDEPTATVDDEEPTETTESSGDRLVGVAETEDDRDDVSNILMNEPDDPLPGIDLTRVRLEGDGNQITVTIETAGDFASGMADDQEVSFDVHIWQDDMPRYAMSFKREANEDWEASVTDFDNGMDEETVDTEVVVEGNTLTASFSADLFPELEAEFEWYSSVMLSEGGNPLDAWFDGAPENIIALLGDPEEFVEFPQ